MLALKMFSISQEENTSPVQFKLYPSIPKPISGPLPSKPQNQMLPPSGAWDLFWSLFTSIQPLLLHPALWEVAVSYISACLTRPFLEWKLLQDRNHFGLAYPA